MKKFFVNPEAELIELDALITTMDVSETQGEPGAGGGDENVTGLYD